MKVPGATFTQVLGLSNSGVVSGFINTDSAFLLGDVSGEYVVGTTQHSYVGIPTTGD